MKRIITILLLAFATVSYSQTQTQLNGTFAIGGVADVGAGDHTIYAIFNDLSGTYSAGDIQVGDEIWDAKCDRYEIVSITSINPNIEVEVTDLNGAAPTTGQGVLFRRTTNFDYPLITSGLSNSLLACIEDHRAIEIDEDIGGSVQQMTRSNDTIYLQNGGFALVNDEDSNPLNEIQTIGKGANTVTLSDGGGSFDVLPDMSGQNGNYLTNDGTNASWAATPSGEATTVTDGTTVDLTLTGVDITAEVIDGTITPAKLDRTYIETNDGDGIYTGSGAIQGNTTVTGNGQLRFDVDQEVFIEPQDNIYIRSDDGQVYISGNAIKMIPFAQNGGIVLGGSSGAATDQLYFGNQRNDSIYFAGLDTVGISNGAVLTLVDKENGRVEFTEATATGGTMHTYQQGNAMVMSFGGASGDVTYSLSGNTATVTVPLGVKLMYIRVNEETANLGGGSDFILRIVDNNAIANQGTSATFMPPSTDFIKRDNLNTDPPNNTFPFVYTVDNAPTPQVQITGYGSNQIDVTFKNVDSFTKWTAVANF